MPQKRQTSLESFAIGLFIIILVTLGVATWFGYRAARTDRGAAACTTDTCCSQVLGYAAYFNQQRRSCAPLQERYTTIERGNPAVEFCLSQGGVVQVRYEEDDTPYGICIFEDGFECEQWDFLNQTCRR